MYTVCVCVCVSKIVYTVNAACHAGGPLSNNIFISTINDVEFGLLQDSMRTNTDKLMLFISCCLFVLYSRVCKSTDLWLMCVVDVSLSSIQQNGSWTSKNPVSAEKRQEAGGDQEIQRPRPEDRSESGTGVHMCCLQVTNARSQDLQAAFWEQAPQESSSPRAGGCGGMSGPHTHTHTGLEAECIKHHIVRVLISDFIQQDTIGSYPSFIHASSSSPQTWIPWIKDWWRLASLSTLFQSTCLGYDQISVLPQPALTRFSFLISLV